MKLLGENYIEYPETPEEAREWDPRIYIYALHQKVLCVAIARVEGTWIAYCSNVPGSIHRNEYKAVLAHGDKLPEKLAKVMFPLFDGVPYSH